MKICVYGAVAIGGCLGLAHAEAGAAVSEVARGAHVAAMGAHDVVLAPLHQRAQVARQARTP